MSTFFNNADIAGMIKYAGGVAIDFDGISSQMGLVDYSDAVTFQENGIGGVINKAVTVTLQTSAFPSLVANNAVGKQIRVDGALYIVRQRLQQTDGALTHLLCTN